MAAWLALVRMPLTPAACNFSCYNYDGQWTRRHAESMLLGAE